MLSLIFFIVAGNLKAVVGHNTSFFSSLPPGSLITVVLPGDGAEIREFRLHSIYSRLSKTTVKSPPGIPVETKNNCVKAARSSTFPLGLCFRIPGNFVVTTSTFKPLPGDTLTVEFSGTTFENHIFKSYFTIDIACSFDRSQHFYGSLEYDAACINRTKFNATKGSRMESYQWESLLSDSEYNSFLLEIDSSRFSAFINKSIMVAASLDAPAIYGQFNQKASKRSLAFELRPQAGSNIVRIPIDEALRPRAKRNRLAFELLTGVINARAIRLPYVKGAVKLVMLSRSSMCSRNECKEGQLSTEVKRADAQVKGCYTIGQLYKSCYGKC